MPSDGGALQRLSARLKDWIAPSDPPTADTKRGSRARSRAVQRGATDFGADSLVTVMATDSRQPSELNLVRTELRQLLSQHPSAKQVVPHLAHVAHALRGEGFTALRALPVPLLRSALGQLRSLVQNVDQHVGLALLQRRLQAALATASSGDDAAEGFAVTAMGDGGMVLMQEANFDAFEKEERAWSDTLQPADVGLVSPAHPAAA